MALRIPHAPGATPLRHEELAGLKLPATTPAELNELEAANIIRGFRWALTARKTKLPRMLSDEYVRLLHKRMFGDVWKWAGTYRLHDTNIGVVHQEVRVALRQLYDDAIHWIDHDTYAPVELAIRLHHRLIAVHPFPNGNGRHGRAFADLLLLRHFKLARLSWGRGKGALSASDPRRQDYIPAMVTATNGHDYGPLLAFCDAPQARK
jgi:Fic-DOC domain mobile mystery protein B